VTSRNHKAPRYVLLSIPLLRCSSYTQISSSKQTTTCV